MTDPHALAAIDTAELRRRKADTAVWLEDLADDPDCPGDIKAAAHAYASAIDAELNGRQ